MEREEFITFEGTKIDVPIHLLKPPPCEVMIALDFGLLKLFLEENGSLNIYEFVRTEAWASKKWHVFYKREDEVFWHSPLDSTKIFEYREFWYDLYTETKHYRISMRGGMCVAMNLGIHGYSSRHVYCPNYPYLSLQQKQEAMKTISYYVCMATDMVQGNIVVQIRHTEPYFKKRVMTALMGCHHERLGANSKLRVLPQDLLRKMLCRFLFS